MEELDIPILKKAYDLYKTIYGLRLVASKQTRHGLWQQIENTVLALVVCFFRAGQSERTEKKPHLEEASTELNLLRLLIRLARDVGTIELKQYVQMQTIIDEIGRMLGGWIKSVTPKVNPPPQRN